MISIIVPVYNVEKFLSACIDSVIAQTYQDWELLLIDDGSPDNSGKICDDYAAKDSRIRVFHKENGGVSSARNLGLDEAKGEWIMFVDADDTIDTRTLEICIHKAIENDVEVVQYQSIIVDKKGGKISRLSNIILDETISNYDYTKLVMEATVPLVIWDKLYKKSVIVSHRFISGMKIGEDFLYLVSLFCRNSIKILRIKDFLYNYRILENSATRRDKRGGETYNEIVHGLVKIYDNLCKEDAQIQKNVFVKKIAFMILGSIRRQGFIKHIEDWQLNYIHNFCDRDLIFDEKLATEVDYIKSVDSRNRLNFYLTIRYLKDSIRDYISHMVNKFNLK